MAFVKTIVFRTTNGMASGLTTEQGREGEREGCRKREEQWLKDSRGV